jgi:hypothetical protein
LKFPSKTYRMGFPSAQPRSSPCHVLLPCLSQGSAWKTLAYCQVASSYLSFSAQVLFPWTPYCLPGLNQELAVLISSTQPSAKALSNLNSMCVVVSSWKVGLWWAAAASICSIHRCSIHDSCVKCLHYQHLSSKLRGLDRVF